MSSPPRVLPRGTAGRRASLEAGGAVTKPLGSPPVRAVSGTTARRESAAAAGLTSPLLRTLMAAAPAETSSAPRIARQRPPLGAVAVNGARNTPYASLVGSPIGAAQPNKGAAAASERSRASAGRRAAGSTRSTDRVRIRKENVGTDAPPDAAADAAARSVLSQQNRGGKTLSKLAAAAEAKAQAAAAAAVAKPPTVRRSARTVRTSKDVSTEKKVPGAAAVTRRPAGPTATSRRTVVDPQKTIAAAQPRRR